MYTSHTSRALGFTRIHRFAQTQRPTRLFRTTMSLFRALVSRKCSFTISLYIFHELSALVVNNIDECTGGQWWALSTGNLADVLLAALRSSMVIGV